MIKRKGKRNVKKIDKLSDSLDEAVKNLNDISNRLKEMQELMLKLWRAEDMEENDGEFRWPFDTHGNLLDNVNLTERLNGNS